MFIISDNNDDHLPTSPIKKDLPPPPPPTLPESSEAILINPLSFVIP